MMDSVFNKIVEMRLVPVVRIEDSQNAAPPGQALMEGNLPIADIHQFGSSHHGQSAGTLPQ
jgi:2-keto-3-deoxy-6-phosphogluconate aldolase